MHRCSSPIPKQHGSVTACSSMNPTRDFIPCCDHADHSNYKLRLHYIYTSQDDKITSSDALQLHVPLTISRHNQPMLSMPRAIVVHDWVRLSLLLGATVWVLQTRSDLARAAEGSVGWAQSGSFCWSFCGQRHTVPWVSSDSELLVLVSSLSSLSVQPEPILQPDTYM